MLTQLHHQSKADRNKTEFVSQFDCDQKQSDKYWKEVHEAQYRHPLPDGYEWMICNKDSEHFILAAPPQKKQNWDNDLSATGFPEAAPPQKGQP